MIPSTLMLMRMQGKYSSMLHHLLSFVTEAFFDLMEATRGRTSGGVGRCSVYSHAASWPLRGFVDLHAHAGMLPRQQERSRSRVPRFLFFFW